MQKLNKILIIPFLILALALAACAGKEEVAEASSGLFLLHQDHVIPNKLDEYKEVAQQFRTAVEEHKVEGLNMYCSLSEEFVFTYAIPIDNYAALEDNLLAKLADKMGQDKFESMMGGFEGLYSKHLDWVVKLQPDMSYLPKSQPSEGANYRNWTFVYCKPDKRSEMDQIIKDWVQLYSDNDIQMGWRTYTSVIGPDADMYIVVQWAENPVQMAAMRKEVREKLGDKLSEMQARTTPLYRKRDIQKGWMQEELSYPPPES